MRNELKKIIQNKVVLAAMSIIAGIVLIARQKAAVDSLVKILGVILLISAAVFVALYLLKREERNASRIVSAVLSGVVGLFFVARPGAVVNFFPVMMGIVLILSGVMDLAHVLSLPRGFRGKGIYALLSAVIILLGIMSVFHPGAIADAIVLYIGISLLVNGVMDIVVLIASGR